MFELPKYTSFRSIASPWLERIPSHWRAVRTKSMLHERSIKGYPDEPLLAATQTHGVIRKSEYGARTVTATKDLHLLKLVEVGDFVISLRSFQGGIERCYHRGIISPAYTVLTANSETYRDYLTHLFKSTPFISSLSLAVTGIREGQTIDYSKLATELLPVPPPDEQAAIVKYLAHANARIDKAIAAKRRLIALITEQKSALLAQIVGSASGDRMRLKNVAVIQTGLTLGKNYREAALVDYPYLRVANVQMGHVDTTDVATVAVPPEEARRCTLRPGDVLMTEGGDIDKLGRGTVWDGSVQGCLHQNHVFAVRCGDQLLPEFLAAWLAAPEPRRYFYVTAKKTTNLAATNSTTVRELPITVPSVKAQEQLLQRLQQRWAPLDVAILKAAREVALLQEFRRRLVADVVTGQVDVRGIARNLPDMDAAVTWGESGLVEPNNAPGFDDLVEVGED
ncbi:hypothetical protein [Nocardia farcinica]|uniref:hypothetical protein n=1 Tax=Nocardia farcinica TaxID=37329 RepID=UPI001895C2B7|nr:hypothetical protein [Nocardia farcinica]MBF6522629.1 hypothetical protein [Nocardia farcinica]